RRAARRVPPGSTWRCGAPASAPGSGRKVLPCPQPVSRARTGQDGGMTSRTWTFTGRILGVGTTSGVRLVVGVWDTSPLGAFADVMVERADGHRVLLAPSQEVADFVTGTYTFDETRLEPVEVVEAALATGTRARADGPAATFSVATPSLTLAATLGRRTALGWLLRGIPRRVAASPLLSTVTDPVARVVLRGVRTRGS